MYQRMNPFFHSRQGPHARTELVLRLADGSPWRLSVTPGMERFIGHYPRLPSFGGESGLLHYRSVAPAS